MGILVRSARTCQKNNSRSPVALRLCYSILLALCLQSAFAQKADSSSQAADTTATQTQPIPTAAQKPSGKDKITTAAYIILATAAVFLLYHVRSRQ